MRSRTPVQYLHRIAVLIALFVGGVIAWDHISNQTPGDATYRAASDAFSSGDWTRAHALFAELSNDQTHSLAARRGQVNSLVQLARYEEAHALISRVIADEPNNACNYATRGIVADHLGRHRPAMADYAKAVAGRRAAVHGMTWFQRLLSNTHQHPPTIAARLNYLRAQMELPETDRVLRVPSKDRVQKPWTT